MKKDIPKDYFSKLPNRIMQRLGQDSDDVRENGELLSKIGMQEPYTIPDNYFEELTDSIISKTDRQVISRASEKSRVVSMIQKMTAVAALGALIVYMSLGKGSELSSGGSTVAESDISTDNISEEVLLDELIYYGTDDISDAALAEWVEGEDEEFYLDAVSDEELDLYLDALLDEMTDYEFETLL